MRSTAPRRPANRRPDLHRPHLPQALQKPPHLRASYRISVCLRASARWIEGGEEIREPGVVANLSGGGAQVFLRRLPAAGEFWLDLEVPDAFVEETARGQLLKGSAAPADPALCKELFRGTCERLRLTFGRLGARIVHVQARQEDQRGTLHALSVAFAAPHEGCFRLVRYLERQAIRRGIHREEAFPTLARVA